MHIQLKEKFLIKYGWGIISLLWLTSTVIYVTVFGINGSLEAVKYIGAANELLEKGHFSETRYWFYLLTTFFIAVSFFFKCGLTGAFVLQAAYNLLVWYWFYKALVKLFEQHLYPVLIIAYLLFFWPYQSWITFLYTESAFYSSVLLLFSCLVLFPLPSKSNWFRVLVSLVLVIISRPLGILFVGSTGLYCFVRLDKKGKFIFGIIAILVAVGAVAIVNMIFSTISDWSVLKPFVEENIICDLPSQKSNVTLQLTRLGSPIYQLWYYCTHNPAHFLHYAGIKLKYFFFLTRSYYSFWHNAFLLGNIIPVYLLAAGAILSAKIKYNMKFFIGITIVLFALAIALQCDDWHNRFILAIYPFFVILAAYGFKQVTKRFKKTPLPTLK